MKSLFITLEGIEGSGKTTQQHMLRAFLQSQQQNVLTTREPGGCETAEQIRNLVLKQPVTSLSETLLLFAARHEHITHTIRPALQQGCHVISDRFTESTYAYQGGGRKINTLIIDQLAQWTLEKITPDITFLLDINYTTSCQRIAKRKTHDRIEQEHETFFNNVRETYLKRAKQQPHIHLINANAPPDIIQQQLQQHLKKHLPKPI